MSRDVSNTNKYGNWYEEPLAKRIIHDKYFHDGEKDFADFANRVSKIFTEDIREEVKQAMYDGDLFVAGRALYGAGSKGKFKASMNNCYILQSPKDSLESIVDSAKDMAVTFSYGGGCGINISNLRPKDAKVNNAARTSTGAVSFMELYNQIGGTIGYHGRRAALLIGLSCSHPDLEEFLEIKRNNDKIQMANISILFDDSFMQCVKEDKKYMLKFFIPETQEFISKEINARDFFKRFAEMNWNWAEPGSIFIDTVRRHHLLSGYPEEEYKIEISNPCAEFFGNMGNSCCLSSINLYNCVSKPFTDEAEIDYKKLKQLVFLGVKVLNEVLDYGYDSQPLDIHRKCIDDWRSIGLGLFGVADALVALGKRYGEKDTVEIIKSVGLAMKINALTASALWAKEHGPFGKYDFHKLMKSEMFKNVPKSVKSLIFKYGLGNGSLLSIAPTGTISTMCGHTGGVEPIFQISYDRTTHTLEKEGKAFHIYAKSVWHLLKEKGIDPDTATIESIKKQFPYVVDTYDINPFDRVKFQAALQENIDNAISSTVNLKEGATIDDVFNVYMAAWESGCKGITVFRDNCKRISILGKKKDDDKENKSVLDGKLNHLTPKKRGNTQSLWGRTFVYRTACVRKFYVTVNVKDNEIFEVFVNAESGCQSNINTITRLTSYSLRLGGKVDDIINELRSTICPACSNLIRRGVKGINKSCPSCIADALEEMQKTLNSGVEQIQGKTELIVDKSDSIENCNLCKQIVPVKEMDKPIQERNDLSVCPECGQHTLKPEGKCVNCFNCGYSKCD